MLSRLHFIEHLRGQHYRYRYGSDVFDVFFEEGQWWLLHHAGRLALEGDNLHGALYHAIAHLQNQ